MLRIIPLSALLITAAAVRGQSGADKDKKPAPAVVESKITIVLPARSGLYEDTHVKVNGNKIDADSDKPMHKIAIEKGKQAKFTIEVDIQPNNYTRLFRTREITIRAGNDAEVDFTGKDPTERILARWVPTPDDIVDEMCKLAKIGNDDVVYDLGCGDAVQLIRAVKIFGAKRGVGTDIDDWLVEKSKEKIKRAGLEKKIEIRKGDVLDIKEVSEANVVLLYMSDEIGERLGPMLKKTMKPGSRVVSYCFGLGDWMPDRTVILKGADGDFHRLHLWTIAEK